MIEKTLVNVQMGSICKNAHIENNKYKMCFLINIIFLIFHGKILWALNKSIHHFVCSCILCYLYIIRKFISSGVSHDIFYPYLIWCFWSLSISSWAWYEGVASRCDSTHSMCNVRWGSSGSVYKQLASVSCKQAAVCTHVPSSANTIPTQRITKCIQLNWHLKFKDIGDT